MTQAIYVRVSTDEQAREGFSIEAQIAAGKKYCELHDLSEPEIYNDAGYSAKDDNRPELQRLINDIRARRINTVIVYRIDRLSRNLTDFFQIMEALEQKDVSFVSIMEYFDTSSASGRLMRGILAVLSAFYREQLAENTRAGIMQRIREGKWSNHAPTGYRNAPGGLEITPEAEMVRLAYRMRAEGKSKSEICRTTGIKKTTLLQMLTNPAYLGLTYENKEIFVGQDMRADNLRALAGVFKGIHQPLIDDQAWNAVQKLEKFFKGTWRRKVSKRHALSGLIFCGSCGSALEIKQTGPKSAQYKCIKKCGAGSKSVRLVELALIKSFDVLKNDLDLIREVKKELQKDLSSTKNEKVRNLKTIEKEIKKIKARTRTLFDLYYEGKIEKDQFADENQILQERLKALGAEKVNWSLLEHEKENELLAFEDFMTTFKQKDFFPASWQEITTEEKRNFLLETVERLILSQDGLIIQLFSFPDYFISWDAAQLVGCFSRAARGTRTPTL